MKILPTKFRSQYYAVSRLDSTTKLIIAASTKIYRIAGKFRGVLIFVIFVVEFRA